MRLAQQDLRDLDVARFLDLGALDPARAGNLVPVTPHRGIGGFSGWACPHSCWAPVVSAMLQQRSASFEASLRQAPQDDKLLGCQKRKFVILRSAEGASRRTQAAYAACVLRLDDVLLLQRRDFLGAEAEPGAEHLVIVLPQ